MGYKTTILLILAFGLIFTSIFTVITYIWFGFENIYWLPIINVILFIFCVSLFHGNEI